MADLTIHGIRLDSVCEACRGEGYVQAEAWRDWWREHQAEWRELTRPDAGYDDARVAALDATRPHGPEEEQCSECGGQGRVPTAAGLAIIDLVARYGSRRGEGVADE